MGTVCTSCAKCDQIFYSKVDQRPDNKPVISERDINVIQNNWQILKLDIANIGTMTFVG